LRPLQVKAMVVQHLWALLRGGFVQWERRAVFARRLARLVARWRRRRGVAVLAQVSFCRHRFSAT
jgi:hypothetical protein